MKPAATLCVQQVQIGDVVVQRVGDEWHVQQVGPTHVAPTLDQAIQLAHRIHSPAAFTRCARRSCGHSQAAHRTPTGECDFCDCHVLCETNPPPEGEEREHSVEPLGGTIPPPRPPDRVPL